VTLLAHLVGFVIVFAPLKFVAALFVGPLDQSLTSHPYA
jgi:hypothetical protein